MKRANVLRGLDEFRMDFRRDPLFARCILQWKDDESLSNVTIALFEYDGNAKDDERIFFYAGDIEGYLHLFEADNGEDFILIEPTCYALTLNNLPQ